MRGGLLCRKEGIAPQSARPQKLSRGGARGDPARAREVGQAQAVAEKEIACRIVILGPAKLLTRSAGTEPISWRSLVPPIAGGPTRPPTQPDRTLLLLACAGRAQPNRRFLASPSLTLPSERTRLLGLRPS